MTIVGIQEQELVLGGVAIVENIREKHLFISNLRSILMNNNPKIMRRNRRFKIFLIWLAEVNILVLLKVLASKVVETELVIVIVKCATILAVTAITGLSGVHMVKNWADGKRGNIPELPKPSEEEEDQ